MFSEIADLAGVVKSKEEVFEIMGKYYGNAHYREAIERAQTRYELAYTARLLDEFNALGYNFAVLHRLTDNEDVRFMPIILEHLENNALPESLKFDLIAGIAFRSYSRFIPEVIKLYKSEKDDKIKWWYGNALMLTRSKKYLEDYLSIVLAPDFNKPDLVMTIVLKYKDRRCIPKLLELAELDPEYWKWEIARYAGGLGDVSLLPLLERYAQDKEGEVRRYAGKSIQKIKDIQEAK